MTTLIFINIKSPEYVLYSYRAIQWNYVEVKLFKLMSEILKHIRSQLYMYALYTYTYEIVKNYCLYMYTYIHIHA